MSNDQEIEEEEEEEEEKEIIQPSVGFRHKFMMDDEKVKLDNPRNELWGWLLSFMKPFKGKFVLFFIFLLLGTVIQSITPLLSASIIDLGIINNNSSYVINVSVFLLSILIFMAVISYIAQYGMGKISQKVTYDIRNDLFLKLQDMSLNYFDQRPSGDIMSIMTNDVTQLNQLVGGQFVQIISSIVSVALTVIIMFILNPFLALISMVVFPIYLLISYYFKKVAMGLFKASRKSIGKVTSSIQENIAGAKVVQAYGQENRAASEFDKANKANYIASLKIRKYMATIFPLIMFITTTLTVAILLAGGFTVLGGVSIFGRVVSIGVLTAYISILGQFFKPFMMLMQIQQIIEAALAATDRIYSLLVEKVEIPDDENPLLFSTAEGNIEFENVSFGYVLNGNGSKVKEEKLNPLTNMTGSHPMGLKEGGPPVGMMQNPMFKKAIETIKSFPEPYSSFIMKNMMHMPPNIMPKLMMSLMGTNPNDVPAKIDQILAEDQYAVPGTEMAKNHPDYKTTFIIKTDQETETQSKGMPFQSMIPPESLLMMVKFLERSLKSSSQIQTGGSGMGGESGGMMGGGMPQMSPTSMINMLARMPISPDIYDQFPNIVKEAIVEQKRIIQHEESTGYILKDLDLSISAGITIAIVGETGAGKTTLIKLIGRFYDINNGKILVDDVDIRKVRKKDLRDTIGLVPQDAFLFTGTVRENLLYAFEAPTPELEKRMYEVSKFLGLHNFIETLHKKYDTKLKENGSNISIGQRQLIAFARALITDPKILILDEATSSVDPYTETLIQDALNKARKGRTTVIIAHRLSTVKNADLIVVLGSDSKGIVEQGDHEALISLNGKYKRLLEMQRRDVSANQ
ncbi:MAG: ABC transporter ATP-binding protein [Promethearchaeota archaeon]